MGFLAIVVIGRLEEGEAISKFQGYPFRLESLWLPFALVCSVAAAHWAWPSLSVLLLVALLAPPLAAAVLAVRSGVNGAARTVARFALTELPGMGGELTLFLAAGVLGGGLTALVSAYPSMIPAFALTPGTAMAALAGIVVAAMAGVHPLVSVTTLVAVAPAGLSRSHAARRGLRDGVGNRLGRGSVLRNQPGPRGALRGLELGVPALERDLLRGHDPRGGRGVRGPCGAGAVTAGTPRAGELGAPSRSARTRTVWRGRRVSARKVRRGEGKTYS